MNHLSTSEQVAPVAEDARPDISGAHRLALLAWASVLAVALLIGVVEASLGPELALRQARANHDWRKFPPALLVPGDFLLLTMTANAAILAWAIRLDSRAKTVGRDQDERLSLAVPSFLAVGAVTIWANTLAERAGLSDSLLVTIGVVLPTLATTAFLLWRSALELSRNYSDANHAEGVTGAVRQAARLSPSSSPGPDDVRDRRDACPTAWLSLRRSVPSVALLAGYVLTVAALEMWLCGRPQTGNEDLMISAHSLLIGLAVGVRLAVWCATESPSTAQEAS